MLTFTVSPFIIITKMQFSQNVQKDFQQLGTVVIRDGGSSVWTFTKSKIRDISAFY